MAFVRYVMSGWIFKYLGIGYEEHEYPVNERLHIDKDILFPKSNIYSPKTCLLVPQRINMLFVNLPNKRGLPNGIIKHKNGYLSKYNGKELGVYPTLEEAYEVYANVKENKIKEVADEYRNIIPKETYEALYRNKEKIENHNNYKER